MVLNLRLQDSLMSLTVWESLMSVRTSVITKLYNKIEVFNDLIVETAFSIVEYYN